MVEAAAKLVLEPIFEADFEDSAYGYRPGRSGTDAIKEVHRLICRGYTDVVDAELSKYFDTIPHSDLLKSVARRIVDRHVLRLIKLWLKAPIEERDGDRKRYMSGGKSSTCGTPQGGVASPLLSVIYMNRFLKHWRLTGRGEAFRAHVVSYADDFVKAEIGAQDDAHCAPRLADLGHDPLDLFDRSLAGVDIGASQLCRQKVPAAEDVERQIAVAAIIAVEEPSFLVAMQRIIGGVEIEHDLARRLVVGFHEQLDEQGFNRILVVADLMIARRLPDTAMLQPVQRRFAGKHCTVFPLRRQALRQKCEHRVVAQRVVVIDVLVTECDRYDALPDQGGASAVNRAVRIASIDKARGHAIEQANGLVGMAQQKHAGVRGDGTAVETGDNFVAVKAFKFALSEISLFASALFRESVKPLLQLHFYRFAEPMHPIVRIGLENCCRRDCASVLVEADLEGRRRAASGGTATSASSWFMEHGVLLSSRSNAGSVGKLA